MRRTYAMLVTLPLLSGCFQYVPLEAEALTPRVTVRAHLTSEGLERHQARLGLDHSWLEGTVGGVSDGGFQMVMGGLGPAAGAPVEMRWIEVGELERRQLDRTRTFLLAGAGAAAGVGLLYLAGGEASSDVGDGGGGDFIRLPLLRLSWPIGGG